MLLIARSPKGKIYALHPAYCAPLEASSFDDAQLNEDCEEKNQINSITKSHARNQIAKYVQNHPAEMMSTALVPATGAVSARAAADPTQQFQLAATLRNAQFSGGNLMPLTPPNNPHQPPTMPRMFELYGHAVRGVPLPPASQYSNAETADMASVSSAQEVLNLRLEVEKAKKERAEMEVELWKERAKASGYKS